MKRILGFAGSTSSTSINKQLVLFTGTQLKDVHFDLIDLNEYPMPIYSTDEEKNGIPPNALKLNDLFNKYDGFIISLAEHNGSYAAAFKNIFDWVSRIEKKIFREKPLLLMATSPGGRGGMTVLETAKTTFPHMGAKELSTFSLPNFHDNFKEGELSNEDLAIQLKVLVADFETKLTIQ